MVFIKYFYFHLYLYILKDPLSKKKKKNYFLLQIIIGMIISAKRIQIDPIITF